MKYIIYVSLLINLLAMSNGQPANLRHGSQELYEFFRVRRQAGYVYDKPSVSFDLPTRAPSSTVTTQAPTVDRTQAQMMYYAYPAPTTGGNALNIGGPSGAAGSGSGSTGTASSSTSGGYNYGAPNSGSPNSQSATGSSQVGSVQSSTSGSSSYGYNAPPSGNGPALGSGQAPNGGSSGYGYNAPSAGNGPAPSPEQAPSGGSSGYGYNTQSAGNGPALGSGQTSSGSSSGYGYNAPSAGNGPAPGPEQAPSFGSSGYGNNAPSSGNGPAPGSAQAPSGDSSGYGYNAPSAGGAEVSTDYQAPNVDSTQANNAGSTQVDSNAVSAAGYEYNVPTITQGPGLAAPTSVSTSAPAYLPPTSGGGKSNNSPSGLVSTETGGTISENTATFNQPADQYLPPLISKSNSPVTPVEQYLPPDNQLDSPSPSGPTPSTNDLQNVSGPGPSSSYIPPSRSQPPLSVTVTNATPRPFSPAPSSTGYLPPVENSQTSVLNSPSPPAPSYLPPVL